MTADESPLTGPPPTEVPLTDAPLVRVVAQVRFPLVASVEKRDFIGPFQEAIRAEYPVLRPEQSRSFVLGQQELINARANTVWRFHDAVGALHRGACRIPAARGDPTAGNRSNAAPALLAVLAAPSARRYQPYAEPHNQDRTLDVCS